MIQRAREDGGSRAVRARARRRSALLAVLPAYLVYAAVCAPTASARAQTGTAASRPQVRGTPAAVPSVQLLSRPARDWIVDASQNEIKAIHHEGSFLRYRVHSIDHRGDRVREAIETKDGTVARLVLKDGRPLTADEDKDEYDRLSAMLASPSDFAKHVKEDIEGKKLATDLITLLPDAMEFSYVQGQPQTADAAGAEVVIDYQPRPGWNPPTTLSEGLRGLKGRVWIDARSHYVVRMEGQIFQGVNFGWGMLAHIYPGGTLLLEQRSLGLVHGGAEERWIYTSFSDDLRVRAVMLKTIAVHTQIQSSDYRPVDGTPGYQDAIRLLLATPLPAH